MDEVGFHQDAGVSRGHLDFIPVVVGLDSEPVDRGEEGLFEKAQIVGRVTAVILLVVVIGHARGSKTGDRKVVGPLVGIVVGDGEGGVVNGCGGRIEADREGGAGKAGNAGRRAAHDAEFRRVLSNGTDRQGTSPGILDQEGAIDRHPGDLGRTEVRSIESAR